MATWTRRVPSATPTTGLTTNVTSYATPSFTPVSGELLVVTTDSTGSTASAPTVTGSANGILFVKVANTQQTNASVVGRKTIWVADRLVPASPVAMTVTLTFTSGDAGTGANVFVSALSGMSKVGSAAVRQFIGTDNNLAGGAPPTETLPAAPLTENPLLGFIGNVTGSATAITPPTGWTDLARMSYSTPTKGSYVHIRNSGATAAAITWGSNSSAGGLQIVEFDASASGATISAATALAASSSTTIAATVVSVKQGVVPLGATSSLTAPAFLERAASVSLTAGSSLGAGAPTQTRAAAVPLASGSTLAAAGAVLATVPAAVSLVSSSALTSTGGRQVAAGSALLATSTLGAGATPSRPASVSLAAVSDLAVGSPLLTRPASVALSAGSSTTVGAVRGQLATVGLASISSLAVAALRVQGGSAALASSSVLSTAATRLRPVSVSLLASSDLSTAAEGDVSAQVPLLAASVLATSPPTRVVPAGAGLSATHTLVAGTPVRVRPALAVLTTGATLTAGAVRSQRTQVPLLVGSDLVVLSQRESVSSAHLVAASRIGTDLVGVAAYLYKFGLVSLSSEVSLTTSEPVVETESAIALTANGDILVGTPDQVLHPAVTLEALSSLVVFGLSDSQEDISQSARGVIRPNEARAKMRPNFSWAKMRDNETDAELLPHWKVPV